MHFLYDIIGKAVLAVGGAGVLIITVSAFISKIWADLFMKKKISEYDQKIEHYKSELELERERYKSLNEQIVYKNKRIFDTEFEIYKEIGPKLLKANEEVTRVIACYGFGYEESDEEYISLNKYHELEQTILKYTLFMDKDMFDSYNKYCYLCIQNIGKSQYKIEDIQGIELLLNEVNDAMNELLNWTREYLRSMSRIK